MPPEDRTGFRPEPPEGGTTNVIEKLTTVAEDLSKLGVSASGLTGPTIG
jgi:hypothetical protein